jgi:hypothetical protein
MNLLKISAGSSVGIALIYLLFIPTTTTFYSCSKFSDIDTIIKPFDSARYNDSLMSYLDYQPTSPGSVWTYETNFLGIISTYKMTCTDKDSTLPDSKVYRVYELEGGSKEFHLKKDTFEYWTNVPKSSVNNTFMPLKSNAKVGEKWYAGKNGTDTYNAEMIERLTEYKIDNTTYKYVLHIRIYKTGSSSNSIDVYTAAGIGAIQSTGTPSVKLIKAEIK